MNKRLDILISNIESLVAEHDHHLQESLPEDMLDLARGLSLVIMVTAQMGVPKQDAAVATATAYLRTAFGVGYNKGYTDGQDKYEEAIESTVD